MSEKTHILSEMIGKRCIVGFLGNRSTELTIGRILAVDDNFVKLKPIDPNDNPSIVGQGIVSYLNISSIDSIIDANDDSIFNKIMDTLKAQQQAHLAQAEQARREQMRVEKESDEN